MKKANTILNKIKTALDMHVELETQTPRRRPTGTPRPRGRRI